GNGSSVGRYSQGGVCCPADLSLPSSRDRPRGRSLSAPPFCDRELGNAAVSSGGGCFGRGSARRDAGLLRERFPRFSLRVLESLRRCRISAGDRRALPGGARDSSPPRGALL